MKRLTLLTFLVLVNATACSFIERMGPRNDLENYAGDGRIELIVRQQGFSNESYGYALSLPRIRTDKSGYYEFRIVNLPFWPGRINVELATHAPIFGESIPAADRQALKLPDDHKLACRLVEAETGRTIGKHVGVLNQLAASQTLQFGGAKFLKHLFSVDATSLKQKRSYLMYLEYKVGSAPIDGEIQLVLLLDAPEKS